MKILRVIAGAAGLVAAGTAQAQTEADFCAELRRIVAAAGEDPPFASLPRGESKGARPMFGFTAPCGVTNDPGRVFQCQEQLAPMEVTAEGLIAASARCLPGAVRLPDRERDRWGGGPWLRLRAGDVTVSAAEWGRLTRGGRQSRFRVERWTGRDEE